MQKKSKFNVLTFMMLIILGLTFQPAISTYAACPDDIRSYWKLDETTGSTYADFISYNNGAGNLTPDPAPAPAGRVNGAQDFNGLDSGIDVPVDNSYNWGVDDSFSIEFWVKRNGDVTVEQVAIGRDDPTTELRWWAGIETTANAASFVLKDSDGAPSSPTLIGTTDITDDQWHHVVAVRDRNAGANGQNLLYVDGKLDVAALDVAYNTGFDSTADLNIGYWNFEGTPSNHLGGMLDEVAIYDRALTPDEIEDHFEAGETGTDYCLGDAPFGSFPDDTISLWRLDETAGPNYADALVGNDGKGGSASGAADPAEVPPPGGRVNGAQAFNSTDSEIDVPAYNSFNWAVDDSFSIEFWVKRNGDVTVAQVAIGRDDPTTELRWWAGIETTANAASFVLKDSDGAPSSPTLIGTTDITDDQWHHVVAVRDRNAGANGQNLLYVDGKLDVAALDVAYNTGFDSTADLNIGYWNFEGTPSNHLGGMLDEVALYYRALTPDEIEDHFEAGEAGRGIDRLGGVPEIIGTWSSGIWYWDATASTFTLMTPLTGAIDIAAGDFNDDGIADVASSWGSGLWYQDGATLDWTPIITFPPTRVTAGDVTGDGRDEIIGVWSSGIWYWDATASTFTLMTPLTGTIDIAAGDFNDDGIADVASSWGSGLWYQDGATLDWSFIANEPPSNVTAGDVTGDGRDEIIGVWDSGIRYWDATTSAFTLMTPLTGTIDIAAGDFNDDGIADVASSWGSGLWYQDGATLDWSFIFAAPPNRVTAGDVNGQ